MKPVQSVAIDLGATSGRVLLGRWSSGELLTREVHRFPNAFITRSDRLCWEIDALWREIRKGLELAATDGAVASVGIDTWGVDHVLLDARGDLAYPSYAYRDPRTQAGLERLLADSELATEIYRQTAIPPLFYNTSLQLGELIARCPGALERVRRCLFLPDYFNYLLSARMENEVSISSTSQLLGSAAVPAWSELALKSFGVPSAWFDPPIRGQTRLGCLKGMEAVRGAEVVAVPGHDTACAFDAMPSTTDGADLFLSSGTWSLLGFESDVPLLDDRAFRARISNERTGDGRFRPVRNLVGLWLIEGILKDFRTRPESAVEWSELIKLAEACSPLGYLLGVEDTALVNPLSMRAAMDAQIAARGASPPSTLPAYVRLICSSLAARHGEILREFELLSGQTFRRIVLVGGGARNRLLCQETANAAQRPVAACEMEGSALGNIGRQLLALGEVEDLAAFRRSIATAHPARVYLPVS